ncbi:hypothetical protein JAAARDRAFT_31009 [Jaapia argillacea MUCL 33604]|uniref:Uncharacterized protein n=1 Tax=Jaapia argillacea MUCL 33604 TaxID=933084 RepID=A0A067Q3K5_9AGAM|nr:hypothetical protein JAAARDRAFT_31009 [Jaapia argillacea MUCL 33604]
MYHWKNWQKAGITRHYSYNLSPMTTWVERETSQQISYETITSNNGIRQNRRYRQSSPSEGS